MTVGSFIKVPPRFTAPEPVCLVILGVSSATSGSLDGAGLGSVWIISGSLLDDEKLGSRWRQLYFLEVYAALSNRVAWVKSDS